YVSVDDFLDDEEERKILRRLTVIFTKKRTGYIVGKRRLLSISTLRLESETDSDEPAWLNIVKQEYETYYLVACNMRNYDYVLEKDLRIVPEVEIIRF
ncbi:unnamed protein product, partial [marine sediment metagenome]